MPLSGFEPTIPANEPLHFHALDRAATELGSVIIQGHYFIWQIFFATSRPLVHVLMYHSHLTAHTCRGVTAKCNK
jgi:hypothetical protein